jgi:hypothetical protein
MFVTFHGPGKNGPPVKPGDDFPHDSITLCGTPVRQIEK